MFDRVLNSIISDFIGKIPFKISFFLENYNKKEDKCYEFTLPVSLTKDLFFYKFPLWLVLSENPGNAK